MLFKYPLSDSQYARFQHANNDDQIQEIARRAGVVVTDKKVVNGIETMYFKGRCNGTMGLVRVPPLISSDVAPSHWECWIQIRSKPWWLPWAVLDCGFREALK